jgi:catechol 2,3-dioxygenase
MVVAPIHPDTAMGGVALSVASLARSVEHYTRVVGLATLSAEPGEVALGAGGLPLLRLAERPGAAAVSDSPGLYHLALRVPARADLAAALAHLLGQRRWLVGAADHLVSEALYLIDPDGHGIEVYWDRPRAEWPREGAGVRMATLALDARGLLGLADDALAWNGLPAGTVMGHVHLRVSDLDAAAAFYRDTLGFTQMAAIPGALFLGAGGYHHHLGLNVWESRGAPPRPQGSLGLEDMEVLLPEPAALAAVAPATTAYPAPDGLPLTLSVPGSAPEPGGPRAEPG